MTLLRHEARLLIKRLVNANFSHGNDKDVILFHGTGVTGCINALVGLLGLTKVREQRAVVFVSHYEHHSNLLPWRESPSCEVITIAATSTGTIDLVRAIFLVLPHVVSHAVCLLCEG
jgi:selenocysteine lyase/cysteine desulfurase